MCAHSVIHMFCPLLTLERVKMGKCKLSVFFLGCSTFIYIWPSIHKTYYVFKSNNAYGLEYFIYLIPFINIQLPFKVLQVLIISIEVLIIEIEYWKAIKNYYYFNCLLNLWAMS